MTEIKKPKLSSSASEREIDRLDGEFKQFEDEVKSLTMDRLNETPKQDVENQTKLSQNEIEKSKEFYLKPIKTIGRQDKFNERFREKWNFDKEYVQFIAENKEIIGEDIELWTAPYGGVPAEFWKVPTNKPVWGPRYLAEQIKRCKYHRLIMQEKTTQSSHEGTYYGSLVADTTVQRLDAFPVSTRKSIFMGSKSF